MSTGDLTGSRLSWGRLTFFPGTVKMSQLYMLRLGELPAGIPQVNAAEVIQLYLKRPCACCGGVLTAAHRVVVVSFRDSRDALRTEIVHQRHAVEDGNHLEESIGPTAMQRLLFPLSQVDATGSVKALVSA